MGRLGLSCSGGGPWHLSARSPPSSGSRGFSLRLCVRVRSAERLGTWVTGGPPPAVLCHLSAWCQPRDTACFHLTKGSLRDGTAVGPRPVGRQLAGEGHPGTRASPVAHIQPWTEGACWEAHFSTQAPGLTRADLA